MSSKSDPRLEDFDFGGFFSTNFPLGSVHSAMTFLHQRVITADFVVGTDTQGRVYYNLVVLFRLLWHHRILESTPTFWEQIFTDFPPKYGTAASLESVVTHYVRAREAYLRKYGPGKDDSFLARLVDQWRTRPPLDKDLIRVVRQAADVYSRQAQEQWADLLRNERPRLIASKDTNWPVFVYYSVDKNKSPSGPLTGASGSNLSPRLNNGSKQSPKPMTWAPAPNTTTRHVSQRGLPSALPGESDRATQVQRNLLSTPKSKREPGRLTPPAGLQSGGQRTLAPKLAEPHHGKNSGTDDPTREAESGIVTTPQKRPAPGSRDLSPFSKRRLITLAAGVQPVQDGEGCSVVAKPLIQTQGREQIDGSPTRPHQRERIEGSASQGFDMPNPPANAQTLGEMIASAANSSPARSGAHTMPQQSPDLKDGLAFPARDALGAVIRGGQPPAAVQHANPLVLLDVHGTLFAFAQRIENLEGMAAGKLGMQGTVDILLRDMAKLEQAVQEQRAIRTVVAGLSLQIEEFEKAGVVRDGVSASVSATTSALTSTIEGLEKKLGEATDTRTTIAALTRRIVELEKAAAERAAAYAMKVTDLQTKVEEQSKTLEDLMSIVEVQSKILEGLGLKEAGEVVE